MSTDHDFSPHSSARDAPAAQSSRKVPWSDVANSASAGHELPAYTALYGQLGDEELVIRPTSETIIWNTYRNWIHSYRDLPLMCNQ